MTDKHKEEDFFLKKFDIRKIKDNTTIVVIGCRGSGKSSIIRDILFHKQHMKIGKVFSKTDHLNKFFRSFIPEKLISKGFNSDELKKIFIRQSKALEEKWDDPNIFVIIDDCLSDKTVSKDESIQEIFYNGRHYKIFFILAMQQPMGIPPGLRGNIDYTILFYPNNMSDKEKIYKYYTTCFPNKTAFYNSLESLGEHECLILDNNTKSRKLEDRVFHYKAKLHSDFKMCLPQLWNKQQVKKSMISYSSSKHIRY